ncbi:recombinase family protein [Streptomyces mirabilis]|uniref:recombinase family protein n=1 Tax=Streptomyces mirabilis TaxID=68239 RepID=UPI0021C061D4|nr:recombinase family protein [Streptomyces mirabilis]MCT9105842.1 recombinase family protein [Streptomyces mirabilis]
MVATYNDNGRSASKAGVVRLGFDRLIADLTRGHTDTGQPIEGVICVADDRLYRQCGGSRQVLCRADWSARTRIRRPAGCARPVLARWSGASCVPHSGPRPFGWQEDRITLHFEEAKLVRQAIADRIGGKAVRAIAREWCGLGVEGIRGGRPNAQTVTQIMTAPRVCGFRANRGELLLVPETGQPVLGRWEPIVVPNQWHAVCATFSPGSLYLHGGSGTPRLTGRRIARRHLASGFLRCGAELPDGTACGGPLCAQKGRRKRSPYVYSCRSCRRCSISGPLADEILERQLFSGVSGEVRLSEAVRHRWQSGELGLEEKREIIASAFTRCLVRPGVKGDQSWDYSRIEPVWRCADRVASA